MLARLDDSRIFFVMKTLVSSNDFSEFHIRLYLRYFAGCDDENGFGLLIKELKNKELCKTWVGP